MGQITQGRLFPLQPMIKEALELLKKYEPPEGYYLADSGGKDSCVILELAKMAGVRFDAHHSYTTIDFPELVYFLKKEHPETKIEYPKEPYLKRLVVKGFPLRQQRWCCSEYKERGGEGRLVITGIRAAESGQRAKREQLEKGVGKTFLHLIHKWSDEDVWQFIHERRIPYCNLYDEGFNRIGCMFCPFSDKKTRELTLERYPKHVHIWKKAFERLYQNRKSRGLTSVNRWSSGEEMFLWWIGRKK